MSRAPDYSTKPLAENRASGRSLRQVMAGKIAAVVVSAAVFLLLFALTGRAAFSLALTLGQIMLFHLISATKARMLGEPLVFSDFALIRHEPIGYRPLVAKTRARMFRGARASQLRYNVIGRNSGPEVL